MAVILTPDETQRRGLQLLGFPKRNYEGGSSKIRLRGSKLTMAQGLWSFLLFGKIFSQQQFQKLELRPRKSGMSWIIS
jgi:hypothetical protein